MDGLERDCGGARRDLGGGRARSLADAAIARPTTWFHAGIAACASLALLVGTPAHAETEDGAGRAKGSHLPGKQVAGRKKPAQAAAPAAPPAQSEPAAAATVSRAWSAGPSTTSAPAAGGAMSPEVAKMIKFAAFDKLSMKGWITTVPPAAESIFQDPNGLRTALAEYGIGYVAYSTNTFTANMLNNAPPKPQTYQGQIPTTYSFSEVTLSYDLGRVGLTGGQLSVGAMLTGTTWEPLGPSGAKFANLYYFQSLLDDTVQLQAGVFYNAQNYLGLLVAASMATGPQALVPYELGLSRQGVPAPGANLMINLPYNFYNKAGVQRSISPDGADIEQQANPIGLGFSSPDAKALFIDEFGYKTFSSPTQGSVWVRAGGMYNTSPYFDFSAGRKTDTNWGFYAAADVQISQISSAPYEAYQGYYVGGFYMTSDPNKNMYQNYYEGRIYGMGIIPGRPMDQTALILGYTTLSKSALDFQAALTGIRPFGDYASVTVSNSFRLNPGVYLMLGTSYNVHPSATPRLRNSLNFMASLTTAF
ncbi:carbohydrate porin [Bradyrhizobium sp. NAS96.2]|uniref:carbohydrate porin n=1 Tax=Bradyrhizobium sp. NAS96.2 TaxID=1680160 RepID=UPI00116103D7|nr:carbohydrate porin [Bradyrhizobium sp. NAS96.2]